MGPELLRRKVGVFFVFFKKIYINKCWILFSYVSVFAYVCHIAQLHSWQLTVIPTPLKMLGLCLLSAGSRQTI